jgi:hypothetical protein
MAKALGTAFGVPARQPLPDFMNLVWIGHCGYSNTNKDTDGVIAVTTLSHHITNVHTIIVITIAITLSFNI